jgi:hypothetical protein
LISVCSGIKRDGSRCTATVEPPQQYCWWHDPANADKRRRAASKGGKGGGSREIRDLKRRISEVVDAVLEGSQDRGRAAVAIQGFNALRGVLEFGEEDPRDRRARGPHRGLRTAAGRRPEMGSLERRIEILEDVRMRGERQFVSEALSQLSDEELDALEESLDAEARARGEEPQPNEYLEELKRWEAEATERQRRR